MQHTVHETRRPLTASGGALANSGPKGPPSAPPTVPPIIINPFQRETPSPAIDPRRMPPGPPIVPPHRPGMRI
jgi:hypothetical protein